MKTLLFQLCSLLLIHKAESAGCLKKHGFGIQGPRVLVDGQSFFPINLGDCETKCDNLVRGMYKNRSRKIMHAIFYRMNVFTSHQSLISAFCTNMYSRLGLQKAVKQLLEYVQNMTKPNMQKSLSLEHNFGVENHQDLSAHSPLSLNPNYIMNLTKMLKECPDVVLRTIVLNPQNILLSMIWIQPSHVKVCKI